MQISLQIISLFILLNACGGKGSFNNGNQSGSGNAASNKPPTGTRPAINQPKTPGPDLPADEPSDGELFFTSNFKPFVKDSCKPCHSEGASGKSGSIVTYATARGLLTTPSGATASTNNLYIKMRIQPHTDPCGGDETKGACKQVKDWWAAEFPPNSGTNTATNTNTNTNTNTGGGTGSETKLFFTNTVLPKMTPCLGCHASGSAKALDTYELARAQLANKPAVGGGPANNALINKASTTNGVTHLGGKACSQITDSPCQEFQDWYRKEFP